MPVLFIAIPFVAAALVYLALPAEAVEFFEEHMGRMEWLIMGLGGGLFVIQILLCWRALRWRGAGFDNTADRWINHLAQAAEWFPMLGLLGTVAGILQTFSSVQETTKPSDIIRTYAPAITATGAGLFMAFVNILPTWIVILGRDLMMTLGGRKKPEPEEEAS
jgi:hypothetical protein